jgi:hypothetical protein
MNAQEAQTLQLHEIVAWTPDEMKGEVIVMDGSGVKVHWDGSQCGYYQFTDLLSQIEKVTLSEAPKATCLALFESSESHRALISRRKIRNCYENAELLSRLFLEGVRTV